MSEHTDRIEYLAKRLANALQEAGASSVQVIVTVVDRGQTERLCTGAGDFYARLGAAREWLDCADEQARAHMHSD